MRWIRVPGIHLDAQLEHFPQELRDKVLGSIDAGRGPYVFGMPGRGKTHLAIAILRHLMTNIYCRTGRVRSLKYSHVNDMLLDIKGAFSRGTGETEEDMIDRYSCPDGLILDDFGVAKKSDWVVQTIDTIIDRRYRDGKICVITSNLSLDELAAKLDDRIASRITEMCMVVHMVGQDRRAEKAVARKKELSEPHPEEAAHA